MPQPSYWYVASPYTHSDPAVMDKRYDAVVEALHLLSTIGPRRAYYAPIAHWHPTAIRFNMPKDHRFWLLQDACMMLNAIGLIVLTLDGWRESAGVRHEIDWMLEQKKPIEYFALPRGER